MSDRLTRRHFGAALMATGLLCDDALAMGRRPHRGSLRFVLPWATGELDPHDLHDPLAAMFASAMSDSLFALDDRGRPYPTLAEAMPSVGRGGLLVTLRKGLRTGRGRRLTATDAAWSLDRCRARGGAALLSGVGRPRALSDRTLLFASGSDGKALAEVLASPIAAMLPRAFTASRPDGTGAFRATTSRSTLQLTRNQRAARGPAFLSRITVRTARTLPDALRAFEASQSDVGWLSSGLHRKRPGVVRFRAGPLGWLILRTGKNAGSWSAAGVAQGLADSIPGSRLARFGLDDLGSGRGSGWRGSSGTLLVDSSSPYLVEVGRAVAAALSSPGHEVEVRAVSRGELSRARRSGSFLLMLDLVRRIGPGPLYALLALRSAAGPALARRPPRLGTRNVRQMTRDLPLGVLGRLPLSGSRAPGIQDLESWSLGDVWR